MTIELKLKDKFKIERLVQSQAKGAKKMFSVNKELFDGYVSQKVGNSYYFYNAYELFKCCCSTIRDDSDNKFLRKCENYYKMISDSTKDYSSIVKQFNEYSSEYRSFYNILGLLEYDRLFCIEADIEKIAFMFALDELCKTTFKALVEAKCYSRKSKNGISFLEINYIAY